jgi:beta-1,4-N-acetylglucosaminyltransferase
MGNDTPKQERSGDHSGERIRLLAVLGEGGHTSQLLKLVRLLGDSYAYHYMICKEDSLSESRIEYAGPIYRVPRPRGKHSGILGSALRTVVAGIKSIWILACARPYAIISAGPAVAVPVSLLGKLLGIRIIFLESASRVTGLSLSGRIMYQWADLFFVQWPQLAEELPRAIFAGRLV